MIICARARCWAFASGWRDWQCWELESPIYKSTALIIIESDGCFADGIEVATGATIGHRTLRVNDFGKIAATFADVRTGRAIRISPVPNVRERALIFAPDEPRHYFAQLQGYQVMPDTELLRIQEVVAQSDFGRVD